MTAAIAVLFLVSPIWTQSVRGQDTSTPAHAERDSSRGSIEDVPDYLKTGQYETAIQVLREAIETARAAHDHDALRRAYLLLVKTYTVRGNFYNSENDHTSADLYHKEARALIAECLRTPALRHTKPDSPLEYPPEMYKLFDDVRSEVFGSFRVVGLEPSEAFVILDGDTLTAADGQGFLEGVDIPIGSREIVIAHEGYGTINDVVIVSPGVTVERSYQLTKPRGKWWYVGWGSLAAAGATGIVMAVTGGSEPPASDPVLPEPPPPPR